MPDFDFFFGDRGGHGLIRTTFGSSCTFNFCWCSFRPVVVIIVNVILQSAEMVPFEALKPLNLLILSLLSLLSPFYDWITFYGQMKRYLAEFRQCLGLLTQ